MAEPASDSPFPDYLSAYRPEPGVADELYDANGQMRSVWQPFVRRFAQLSPQDIAERFERGNQYLRDAGVFYRQYSNDPLQEREWPLSHIPVVLHESEWNTICAGLTQRANLLEQVMADLYGAGRLVSQGHLPAELIAQNPEWIRPMVEVTPKGGHYLHFLAFEIGRSPDGSWFVLGDRTQAPSGAGFALENRMATGRIFPESFQREKIHRLAGFFADFRQSLERLAGRLDGMPQTAAILTPGPSNDTYYEHTYIARYLGLPLLEGEDITVQNGRAMVRTIQGLQPIGVLWRRMDGNFCDPLELDHASHIGTPGMVEAARQGKLSLVNAVGSGILETRALLAFMPRIAEVLTGQKLKMPNIATWWCGSETERAYVRDNAAKMLIGPALAYDLPFDGSSMTALAGKLRSSASARATITEWLDNEGKTLVGQEAVTLSTTPAWVDGQVRPCPMTVRVFAARTANGWSFMKGGYARIGPIGDVTAMAMQQGGSVADVWIVSDKSVPQFTLRTRNDGPFQRTVTATLPSRAADNLFWLGRYVERCEEAIRLIRAYHLRLAAIDNPNDPILVKIRDHLALLGFDVSQNIPSALLDRLAAARACTAKVRDRFSTDGWLALEDVAKSAQGMVNTARRGDDTARAMGVLLRKITGFSGLVHENMYRFSGWRFLSIGRAIERADALASLLATYTDADAPNGSLDLAIEVADSLITHQRRYRFDMNRDTVIDLLALDEDNPRAILYQLHRIQSLASELPRAHDSGRVGMFLRQLMPIATEFAVCNTDAITPARLYQLRQELAALSDTLATMYLR